MLILCFTLGLVVGYFTGIVLAEHKVSDLESELYYYKKYVDEENISVE